MKELSIEQKAKRYDEALVKAQTLNDQFKDRILGKNIEFIFPELAESEDEKIRKGIIMCVKGNMPDNDFRKKYLAWLEKQGEQKPAWSEEDEEISEAIIKRISGESDALGVSLSSAISWVENVKDRVQPQPKQEWSEEDIELLNNTIKFIEDSIAATSPSLRTYSPTLTGKEIPFLKALKDRVQPQPHWKPSDEQMKCLDNVKGSDDHNGYVLNTLYNDIKKLREE